MSEQVREQTLYIPVPEVQVLQREAARLDRSVSWCLQQAWTRARAQIGELPSAPQEEQDEVVAPPVEKRKWTIFFPAGMLAEIREEAGRLDRSLSWVVVRAWELAGPEVVALEREPDRPA
jgi:uncharacterized small protein (TIGR04563 family)